MKITKYGHACFTVENNNHVVVVDPGNLSLDLTIPTGVVAIVITHAHGDHLHEPLIREIVEKNPGAVVVGDVAVITKFPDLSTKTVSGGDIVTLEDFNLEFFGTDHAVIHESMSTGTNVGVLINDKIYYPGDSFELPGKPVELLALPVSGPWLKLGEVIDFLKAVKPERVFATHNAHNSEAAKGMIRTFMQQVGLTYSHLDIGESIEL
jgi:L-ascorbate metabolism protein UlaG (beta-lactamase superfamily)